MSKINNLRVERYSNIVEWMNDVSITNNESLIETHPLDSYNRNRPKEL